MTFNVVFKSSCIIYYYVVFFCIHSPFPILPFQSIAIYYSFVLECIFLSFSTFFLLFFFLKNNTICSFCWLRNCTIHFILFRFFFHSKIQSCCSFCIFMLPLANHTTSTARQQLTPN